MKTNTVFKALGGLTLVFALAGQVSAQNSVPQNVSARTVSAAPVIKAGDLGEAVEYSKQNNVLTFHVVTTPMDERTAEERAFQIKQTFAMLPPDIRQQVAVFFETGTDEAQDRTRVDMLYKGGRVTSLSQTGNHGITDILAGAQFIAMKHVYGEDAFKPRPSGN